MLGVIAVAALVLLMLGVFGEAVVHRVRATAAADAVAHAHAANPAAAATVRDHYESEGASATSSGATNVTSGPSQAAARAEVADKAVEVAPALLAIVARAEQLLGEPIVPVRWNETSIEFAASDGERFALIAWELGLCSTVGDGSEALLQEFELC